MGYEMLMVVSIPHSSVSCLTLESKAEKERRSVPFFNCVGSDSPTAFFLVLAL